MPLARILVTGFGPFLSVEENPSGSLAGALKNDPPEGVEVTARVLPVSFEAAPAHLAAALDAMDGAPDALLAMGVHAGEGFRLERRARAVFDSHKPDSEGRWGAEIAALPEGTLESSLDFEDLRSTLLAAGARQASISENAGGYVCERTYHALLSHGHRLGVASLFLHVPPVVALSTAEQLPIVRSLVARVAAPRPEAAGAPPIPPHLSEES
ncbi:MAG: hypothetical protein CMJ84_01715 [Planctomycetes bacterium]|jgi:pyroglutamyl-peptidase|nr:hypothetical protein [Planctomycetota bacterium]MDP6410371.1 hypothetical protein [Planctomycetota bacterium]